MKGRGILDMQCPINGLWSLRNLPQAPDIMPATQRSL